MDHLIVSERCLKDRVLVEVSGSINAYSYARFQQKLHTLIRAGDVVLDLSRISCLSSSGVGALISAVEDGEEFGSRFFLLSPSVIVRLAIESSGFAHLFTIVSSENEAD
ncbi:MAG: STAS domain-containing protein [Treponemataceae bacterium]